MQQTGQAPQQGYLAGTRCPKCGGPKQHFIFNGGGQMYACGQCDAVGMQRAELAMRKRLEAPNPE